MPPAAHSPSRILLPHSPHHNVIFRTPSSLFGFGPVEATPYADVGDLAATQSARAAVRIGGIFNTSDNDGTITRFGWKAQNKSLMVFRIGLQR